MQHVHATGSGQVFISKIVVLLLSLQMPFMPLICATLSAQWMCLTPHTMRATPWFR